MRNLFYFIIDYKSIHPIRFWVLIIIVFIGILLLLYLLMRFRPLKHLLSRQKEEKNNEAPAIHFENTEALISTERGNNEKINRTKKDVFKHIAYLVLGIIIGVLVCLFIRSCENRTIVENLSLTNSKYTFGLDISHYQGKIDWDKVQTSHHPIKFVFIRSTIGIDGKDKYFKNNWSNSKKQGYVRGAYHYYRPNENSEKQFKNFSRTVKLKTGDFPPILDIEQHGKYGKANLRTGVKNWLKLAEEHYSVKPLIYCPRNFYNSYLKGHVDEYPLWIASYSGKHRLEGINWTFHQFTDKVKVKGIKGHVDGDDFNGDFEDLLEMCIE